MDFGEVLSRSWRIIWKHKILWVFGIFAGLVAQAGSSIGSRSGSRIQYSFDSGDFSNGIVIPPELQQFVDNVEHFFNTAPVWFWIVLGVSLLILGIAFWMLSIIGRAGLVRGTVDADEDASFHFSGLFNKSLYYFGRLFLFDLLVFACSLVVTVAFALLLIALGVATLGIGLLCLAPFFCLLIPLGWVLSIYLIQVQIALVAEDLGVWQAFSRAWQVVTGKLGEMVVMGLILFIISLAAGIVLTIPFGMVFAPFATSLLTTGGITATAVTAALVIGLVLLPFAILAQGILEAYIFGAWTLTFRRLTGRKAGSPATVQPAAPVAPEAPSAPVDLPPQV